MSDTSLTQPNPVTENYHELHRALGPFNLIMIGIGSIIGAGIFVIAGTAAAEHAGPAVLISFVIAGLGCLFAGLCYAEFASLIPESGSSYTYAYATMGRFMAWFIGWNMVLEYLVSAAGVSAGWSGYLVSLLADFNIHLPKEFTVGPIGGNGFADPHWTGALFNVPAVLLIVILTGVLGVGVKESARFNGMMWLLKVAIVIAVIVFGLSYVRIEHLTPFIPANPAAAGKTGLDAFRAAFHHFGRFGITGILAAAPIAFFAYIGFETVSVAAQEARNPRRDLPIGILGSLGICTVLYMLMALVLTGITDWRTLDVPSPVSFAVSKIEGLTWLVPWIDAGAVVGLASVVFMGLYGQSRVFYSMARDWRRRRARLRGVHGPLRPVARVLLHGPRRLPVAGLRQGASHVQNAACRDHHDRRLCGGAGSHLPLRRAGRPRLHRHARRLHRGLRRHPDPAGDGAARPPAVPHRSEA